MIGSMIDGHMFIGMHSLTGWLYPYIDKQNAGAQDFTTIKKTDMVEHRVSQQY